MRGRSCLGRSQGGSIRRNRSFELLSVGTFVAVGLPDGMLGTAWPSIRATFHAPLADLGLVLLAGTAGSGGVSLLTGRLLRRFGVAPVLGVAAALGAGAGLGFALAPGLLTLIAIAVALGAASGLIDGGLNTAIALSGRRRLLNLLHGAYGIGTALGPLVVTVAVLAISWRPAYVVLVAVDIGLAVAWMRRWRSGAPGAPEQIGGTAPRSGTAVDPVLGHVKPRDVVPVDVVPVDVVPVDVGQGRAAIGALVSARPGGKVVEGSRGGKVPVGLCVFFVYTGLEVSAGQWEASYCRSALGLSASIAGLAVFGYWGALTGVRILLAVPRRTPAPERVVRIGCALAVVGAAGVWWRPDDVLALVSFVVVGASLAGVFPALVSLTPERLGRARAGKVVAWQVGAAAAGGSGISAIVGLVLQAAGIGSLGAAMVVLALLLVAGNAVLEHVAPTG